MSGNSEAEFTDNDSLVVVLDYKLLLLWENTSNSKIFKLIFIDDSVIDILQQHKVRKCPFYDLQLLRGH